MFFLGWGECSLLVSWVVLGFGFFLSTVSFINYSCINSVVSYYVIGKILENLE